MCIMRSTIQCVCVCMCNGAHILQPDLFTSTYMASTYVLSFVSAQPLCFISIFIDGVAMLITYRSVVLHIRTCL